MFPVKTRELVAPITSPALFRKVRVHLPDLKNLPNKKKTFRGTMALGYEIFLRLALSHFENPCLHGGWIFRELRTNVTKDFVKNCSPQAVALGLILVCRGSILDTQRNRKLIVDFSPLLVL